MKWKKNTRLMIVLFGVLVIVIVFGVGAILDFNKTMSMHAATAPYNDPNSANGVRIDSWHEFKNMETYGRNNDYGCGFTAMAILLETV